MLRFLRKVMRKFQMTNTTRTPRRAQRRRMLGLEGLEDRMVLSSTAATASFDPSSGTLSVFANQANQDITFKVDHLQHSQLDLFDGTTRITISDGATKLRQIPIASVTGVDVNLISSDKVIVDDSNGFPFAAGAGNGTPVFFSSTGSGNSLELKGSATIKGDELYVVAGDTTSLSHLLLAGTDFEFVNDIGKVTDSVKITGGFQVSTAGQNVTLTSANGAQTLTNLGPSGGSTLTFNHKPRVDVEQFAANVTVTLDATAAASGEKSFTLGLDAPGDVVNFAAEPVTTTVNVNKDGCFVNLGANTAPVTINGDGTTSVSLGGPFTGGAVTTAGIQANVTITGAQQLVVIDLGNTTTQENVNVTESSISGTGLFGNNSVVVTYSLISTTNGLGLQFFTGQQADTYKLANSNSTASFPTEVTIHDDSNVGLSTQLTVGPNSDLLLNVQNPNNLPNNDLSGTALDGGGWITPNPRPNLKAGTDFAEFAAPSKESQVNYQNLSRLTYSPNLRVVLFTPLDEATSSSLAPLTQMSESAKKQEFGHGSGSYTSSAISSSAPHGYQLTGRGTFLNLGTMNITGSVATVGGFATGEAKGEITFTDAKGSVTIRLIGPEQAGFSALPTTFEYSVEKGTGAYAGMTGFGSLTLKLGPASEHGFTLKGDFSLTINSFERLIRLDANS